MYRTLNVIAYTMINEQCFRNTRYLFIAYCKYFILFPGFILWFLAIKIGSLSTTDLFPHFCTHYSNITQTMVHPVTPTTCFRIDMIFYESSLWMDGWNHFLFQYYNIMYFSIGTFIRKYILLGINLMCVRVYVSESVCESE